MGRRSEAKSALELGARLAPGDARFPTELAGIAFLDEHYGEAKKQLKRALRLAPGDAYLTDFLATVYLLEENLDAALLYWNRIGKPRVEQVRAESLGGDPVLLDRALAFAPASTLRLSELELTRARLAHLGFYAQQRFDLLAREDPNYDLHLQALEKTGFGGSWRGAALSLLRGVPYQTVYVDFFNLGRRGVNVESLARWDPRKRRVNIALGAPVGRDPDRRLEFFLDAREEDWRFDESGAAAVSGALELRKAEGGMVYSSVVNQRVAWRTGVTFAGRGFRNQRLEGQELSPDASRRFADGVAVNSLLGVDLGLLRLPERRLTLDAAAGWRLGRFWATGSGLYSRWAQSLTLRWFPRATGDDYAVETRWRSGQTFGRAPFDELYELGMHRDNELWLRGHRGTADGYKGAALLGDRYLLWNSELDKTVYRHAFFRLTAGPFLDGGTIHDALGWFGSSGWQWDGGVQCKAALAGGLTLGFSYGRNLQSRGDAFYWRIVRR
jgi:hypothetical protein